ncbi:MAG: phosphoribosyl-ATP diphosphatase [Gammaproteobacteria bacterium]|nr:phosphoribosyl-ATP diphosphatase [Gammaproteobacteria bacterium]
MADSHAFLAQLEAIIDQRLRDLPQGSYVTQLASRGRRKIAQKVGEEGVELALAVAAGDREEALAEAADLVFHTMLALRTLDLKLEDVCLELRRRHPED